MFFEVQQKTDSLIVRFFMASGQCSGFIDWPKDSRPLIQRK